MTRVYKVTEFNPPNLKLEQSSPHIPTRLVILSPEFQPLDSLQLELAIYPEAGETETLEYQIRPGDYVEVYNVKPVRSVKPTGGK